MACIQERKDKNGKTRYRVQVRLKGYPPQTATFERLTDARKWVQNTESALREGRYFKISESKKHTMGDLIDRYMLNVLPQKKKSEQRQGAQLLWWKRQLGTKLLSDVSPAIIAELRDKLSQENTRRGILRSPSTVVRYLAALSHAFSIAVKEWGWLDDSPMRKVSKPREPRGRVRFLSDEERKRLLEACKQSSNEYLYIVVVLALSTGMRLGEIMGLKWSDIDLDRGCITLHETKNGERRLVPLQGLALKLTRSFRVSRYFCSLQLFPSKSNFKKSMDLRFPWKIALKQAGIKDFRFHDLRHSAASYLAMNGATLSEIAGVLGHKTLSMVKRYAHLSEEHKKDVVNRMNNKIFG